MIYDIRTSTAAYKSLLDFLGMTKGDFFNEYYMSCNTDFESLWERNRDKLAALDISCLQIVAFHVLASKDHCEEIKANGLRDLQWVLTEDTILKRTLAAQNMHFDIPGKVMFYNDHAWDMDYSHYMDSLVEDEKLEKLSRIALRVDHDFCVNGFLSNPDAKAYGGHVDKRPEFLSYLTERFPELKAVEKQWEQESTSYQVVFFAYPHQTARFQFELDANYDIPFPDWLELSDDLKIKKKLLSLALNTAYDGPGEQYLYIKDGCYIPPEQIISYDVLGK